MARKPVKKVRMTAKLKANARKNIHEPTFGIDQVFESSAQEVSTILNNISWYNLYFDQKKSKDWAIEWISQHPKLSHFKKRFKSMPHQWYGNKGFICRMVANGLQLSEKHQKSLEKSFLEFLEMLPEEVEPAETPQPVVVKYDGPKLKEDPFWSALVDCEDSIIATGGQLDKNVDAAFWALTQKLSTMEKKRAIKTLQKHRKQLVEDVEYAGEWVMHADKRTSKRIIKRLIGHYDYWINKGIKI